MSTGWQGCRSTANVERSSEAPIAGQSSQCVQKTKSTIAEQNLISFLNIHRCCFFAYSPLSYSFWRNLWNIKSKDYHQKEVSHKGGPHNIIADFPKKFRKVKSSTSVIVHGNIELLLIIYTWFMILPRASCHDRTLCACFRIRITITSDACY